MTSNDIISLMNRVPFAAFEIRMSDGNRVRVEEPFQVATRRNSPVCIVYGGDDQTHFVSVRNITEIVTDPELKQN